MVAVGSLDVAEVRAEPRAAQDVLEVEQRAFRSRVAFAEDLLELLLHYDSDPFVSGYLLLGPA